MNSAFKVLRASETDFFLFLQTFKFTFVYNSALSSLVQFRQILAWMRAMAPAVPGRKPTGITNSCKKSKLSGQPKTAPVLPFPLSRHHSASRAKHSSGSHYKAGPALSPALPPPALGLATPHDQAGRKALHRLMPPGEIAAPPSPPRH